MIKRHLQKPNVDAKQAHFPQPRTNRALILGSTPFACAPFTILHDGTKKNAKL
jgi:hypothetical protein